MATATITLQGLCAGQGHARITVTVGARQVQFEFDTDELRPVDEEPIEALREFARLATRFHCRGMTRNQTRNALQGGIDVVTS